MRGIKLNKEDYNNKQIIKKFVQEKFKGQISSGVKEVRIINDMLVNFKFYTEGKIEDRLEKLFNLALLKIK